MDTFLGIPRSDKANSHLPSSGFFGGRERERKTLFVSLPVPARILSLEILVTLGLKENIGVPLAACSLTPDDAVRTNFGCN